MTDPKYARQTDGRDVQLLTAQLDVLAGIVAGAPLAEALEGLLKVVESVSAEAVLGSVLLISPDGARLHHCAAPSLPPSYNEAIDGVAIGPKVGSCGTAAFRREQVIVADIERDPLWDDFRDLALAAQLRACWSTPIFSSGGDLLGTFAMYYTQPRRPSVADLALIDVLVRTVAMAIERSRADAEREEALAAGRTAAVTLQHSLLSQVPARLGAVGLEARYRPGDPGVEVGGDWFDAHAVMDGLVVVVGDVQGHDLAAAALMGQLRTVARTYAIEGHPPGSVLAAMNRYLATLPTELLATALVVHLDSEARVLTVGCAGHLPPLLLDPHDGAGTWRVRDIEVQAGPPLGAGESWPEHTSVLPPAGRVLFYTDGLVENRAWSLEEGMHLLKERLAGLPSDMSLNDLLDAALNLVPSGSRGDDVAVLALSTPACPGTGPRRTQRWFPAEPASVPRAREWSEGALRGWSLAETLVTDSALVASELVTNAIRYSQAPVQVTIFRPTGTEIGIEVFDRDEQLPHLVPSDGLHTSGRGLHIVQQLTSSWGVREATLGKTVWARLGQPRAQLLSDP